MPGIGIYAGKTDKQKWRNINMITSVSNAKIKNVMQLNQRAKARREQGLFCGRRQKDVSGSTGRMGFTGVCLRELSQDGELMAQVEKYPYEIVRFRIPSDV